MPIRDVSARNRSLDNDYGSTRASAAPSSHTLALFYGDPMVPAADGGGVEVSGNGYARVTVAAADWAAAANGMKALTTPKTFPNTTAAWPDTVTHWALYAGTVMWDCAALVEGIDVTGPGTGPVVAPIIFYDDDATGTQGTF